MREKLSPTEEDLIGRGIWLSEQPSERQRELIRKYLFETNRAYLAVLIGPNPDEIMHQDIVFGGNEEDLWKHAQEIAHTRSPYHLNRIEYYRLEGKWGMTQCYDSGPLKRSF